MPCRPCKDDKTILREWALVPSRRNLAALKEKLRRIRTICEFAEAFLGSMFPAAGRGIPAGRAEPPLLRHRLGYALVVQRALWSRKRQKRKPSPRESRQKTIRGQSYRAQMKKFERAARTFFVRRGIGRREYFVYFQGQYRCMTENGPLRIKSFSSGLLIKQKKKQPLTVTRPIFHTVKGYFFVFLVSSILVTSLSTDFLLLCRSRDSQSASNLGSLPRPQK